MERLKALHCAPRILSEDVGVCTVDPTHRCRSVGSWQAVIAKVQRVNLLVEFMWRAAAILDASNTVRPNSLTTERAISLVTQHSIDADGSTRKRGTGS